MTRVTIQRWAVACLIFGAGCIEGPPAAPDATTPSDTSLVDVDATVPDEDASARDVPAPFEVGVDMTPDADASRKQPLTIIDACEELYDRGERNSGVYAFETSEGGSVDLRCEMEVAGGGWTLVGRSVSGAGGLMGWTTDRGDPGNAEEPYSLAAKKYGLTPREFLVTNHDGSFDPGSQRHQGQLPIDLFDAECADAACETSNVQYVSGVCEPQEYAYMFSWAGYADDNQRFFFRDNPEHVNYGLHPTGWNTRSDCDWGGGLDGMQGMLFVR